MKQTERNCGNCLFKNKRRFPFLNGEIGTVFECLKTHEAIGINDVCEVHEYLYL